MIVPKVDIPQKASRIGVLDPNRRMDLTVVLANKVPLPSIHSARSKNALRKHLTHDDLWRRYGAAVESVKVVEAFAKTFNLEIIETAIHRRSIWLAGRSSDISRAFGTKFDEFELNGHKFFAPAGPLKMPAKWDGAIETVLCLHSSPHSWPRRPSAICGHEGKATLPHLASAYAFPPAFDGDGETIGLVEFGGGFYPADIREFCAHLGIAQPNIAVVEIGNGANRPASRRAIHEFLEVVDGRLTLSAKAEQDDPFVAAQSTVEVTMDLEILAALAPAARIVVYFASSGEQGLYHAISRAVHDDYHRPTILSISWSLPEHTLSLSELNAIENVLTEAAHLGITICASSGDAGAMNGSDDGHPSVNYPASSPHCLACGGTSGKMEPAGMSKEVVWNATHHGFKGASGGGVSERFHLPEWQKDAQVPARSSGAAGRGVPDVAALADPRYGCELLIAGQTFASAGTSAVAPMWAALIARLNQALGRRCGHLHPHIYRLGKERAFALRPVLKGNNGLYHAGKGWNACTGYGTPMGKELLAHLKNELLGSERAAHAAHIKRESDSPVLVSN